MSDENSPITIVCTTYFPPGEAGEDRADAAARAVELWDSHLHYERGIELHIADDGSSCFDKYEPYIYFGCGFTLSRQDRHGVGASLNAGFKQGFKNGPLVAYFVDDWATVDDFNLTPWAQLLLENEDIGCVRLGPPHPNLRGRVEMFQQGWALRLDRYGVVCAHRPALYHKRFYDYYGPFDEDCSALECERLYNERYCADKNGPEIVYALYYPWFHVDTLRIGQEGTE